MQTQIAAMSMQRKQSVLSIKDKQTTISRMEKGEKGTNLAFEFNIMQQAADFRYRQKQREDPEIH